MDKSEKIHQQNAELDEISRQQKAKPQKIKSRPKRWQEAVTKARNALEALEDAFTPLHEALSELHDIQQEYQEWYDNMPDNTKSGPTGERLETLLAIDLEPYENRDYDTLESAVSDAESAELPLGFGRD